MPPNKLLYGLLLCPFFSKATQFPTSQGAFALSLGKVSAFKYDPFAAANHAGSLSFANVSQIALGFQSQYFVEGLNTAMLAATYKLKLAKTIGMAYSFFGNRFYNESLLKMSFAQKISDNFGAGISLDYLRMQWPSASSSVKNLLTFEAACYASVNPYFDMALQITNPARVKLAEYHDERLPFVTNYTLIYKHNAGLSTAFEWQQTMNGNGFFKIGLLYKVNEKLSLQAGLFQKPANPCFGLSYASKKVKIHLAFSIHPYLNAASGIACSSPLTAFKNEP